MNERRALTLRAVEMEEPHPDAGGTLHVAGLRDAHVGLGAILGLDPARAAAVPRRAREQIRGHLRREIEVAPILGDAVEIEEELRDAGVAAALPNVVPEARRPRLRDAALEDAVGRLADPRHPRTVAGHDRELIEEPRRARRSVAPAQVIELERVGLIARDETDVS